MSCRLEAIFQRQAEYVGSLHPIYEVNGHLLHTKPFPWPLDNRDYQEEFRLLAWRMTEEIVEAVQLHYEYDLVPDDFEIEFREEIADALHFFVELCLATGVKPGELTWEDYSDRLEGAFSFWEGGYEYTIPDRWNHVIYKLGLAMHELRQRPWRTDNRPTDQAKFKAAMTATFLAFISACKRSDIDADALYEAYFAKSKINGQRREDQKL